jgi:RNA polymerase sigma-70 factor, ECF subfamily
VTGRSEVVSTAAETLALEHAVPRRRIAHGPMIRGRSEQALIRGAQAGSEADLEELFRRHWRRAYRAAYLIVHDHAAAEDIAQESFVAAIRTLHRFDRDRRFAPWLGRIVANRAIDWTRSRTARRESDQELAQDAPAADSAGGTYSDEMMAALKTLTPEHRAVVVMRYVLEYTPGEIARALELPRGTVNSRLRRGLDVLDAQLRDGARS